MRFMHLVVLFFLGLFQISLTKECLDCKKKTDVTDPATIEYVSEKIKNVTPEGTKNEEQTELVRIKDIKKQVVKGIRYNFDIEARGLKSSTLYECKLVVLQQKWLGVDEIKEFSCEVVTSNEQKSSLLEEEFLTDTEVNLFTTGVGFDKKKYVQCMKKAAIKCLL